jgi:hypothetical protein
MFSGKFVNRAAAVAAGCALFAFGQSAAQSVSATEAVNLGGVEYELATGILEPDKGVAPPVALSPADREALIDGLHQRREEVARTVDNDPPSPPGVPEELVPETEPANAASESELPSEWPGTTPQALKIGKNIKNPEASRVGSTLAETSAVQSGRYAFYTGNTFASYSIDGGYNWNAASLPGGPADAQFPCCDQEVVLDDASRVAFHSLLYLNSAQTNGVVRIFVRRFLNTSSYACSYTIDPGGSTNLVPDYPHIGLTKSHLYLSINALPAAGGQFARMYRFGLHEMASCIGTPTQTFSQSSTVFGQRVWVPARGTNNMESMYWGQLDNTTTFRIFRWEEGVAAPTATARSISASTFANPDCRGGINNADFIEKSTAWSIAGFRLRCAAAPGGGPKGDGYLACYWNAANDNTYPQALVRSAIFRLFDLVRIGQPHIWNASECFGFPAVTSNKRGDLGISIALGGKAGGGGSAARGAVGISDEFNPPIGYFQSVSTTAAANYNRADGRYGDYMSIVQQEPCEKWFTATNYGLLNGTAVSNVNARFVEFGRQQSYRCWAAHVNNNPYQPTSIK